MSTGVGTDGMPAGRVAVVTGAGGGIGGGIARAFAQAGTAVVAGYRTGAAAADAVVAEIVDGGGRAVAHAADVTDPTQCAGLMAAAVSSFGRLDAVVANAGIQPVAPLAGMSATQWDEVVRVDLGGTFTTLQAAADVLRPAGGGAIVLVGSVEAGYGAAGHVHYGAAKAGVVALARGAAVEYGPAGVRVNVVSPGLVARPGLAEQWPEGVARWHAAAPLRRLGTPEDVGRACVFLASPDASWITGQELRVDGGVSVAAPW